MSPGPRSAAGDGGEDPDLVGVVHRGLDPGQVADALAVDEHVDVAAWPERAPGRWTIGIDQPSGHHGGLDADHRRQPLGQGLPAVTIVGGGEQLPGAGPEVEAGRVEVAGATVGTVLAALSQVHPGVGQRVLDDRGVLRRHVNVFVNGESIRYLAGIETPVDDTDEVWILPAVSGG